MSNLYLNYGFYDPWLDTIKVTFDGENRLILINDGETEIDVKEDLYSAWKRWATQSDHAKYLPAFRAVGGDPIDATNVITPQYFLLNGWKIRPYEGNHVLSIKGIILSESGEDPLVPTLRPWNISVTNVVAVKSESIVKEVPAAGPTAEEIVNAVWAKMLEGETTAILLKKASQASSNINNVDEIATAVWEKPLTSKPGTFGEFVTEKLLTVTRFLGLK